MFRYVSLAGHYTDSVRFALSSSAVRRRQLVRFWHLFEHAHEHSPFYRHLYRETGVGTGGDPRWGRHRARANGG